MLYEQLKGRPDPTPLQERLLLLVHLKHKQQQMTEMEVLAMMAPPERLEAVKALVERYRRQLFPGQKSDRIRDAQIEAAKRALAEETKKVYLVRRLEGVSALQEQVRKAEQSGHGEFAKAMEYELHKAKMADMRLRARMSRSEAKERGRKPPGGTRG